MWSGITFRSKTLINNSLEVEAHSNKSVTIWFWGKWQLQQIRLLTFTHLALLLLLLFKPCIQGFQFILKLMLPFLAHCLKTARTLVYRHYTTIFDKRMQHLTNHYQVFQTAMWQVKKAYMYLFHTWPLWIFSEH